MAFHLENLIKFTSQPHIENIYLGREGRKVARTTYIYIYMSYACVCVQRLKEMHILMAKVKQKAKIENERD